MEITKDTKLTDILNEYPWLEKELVDKFPAFRALLNPIGRRFVRNATLEELAAKAGKTPDHLIMRLEEVIGEHEAEGEHEAGAEHGSGSQEE